MCVIKCTMATHSLWKDMNITQSGICWFHMYRIISSFSQLFLRILVFLGSSLPSKSDKCSIRVEVEELGNGGESKVTQLNVASPNSGNTSKLLKAGNSSTCIGKEGILGAGVSSLAGCLPLLAGHK